MKKVIILVLLALTFGVRAQDGIMFEHISWNEAKNKAIKENKLIFIDFYTQWCGPCLSMAENVFTQESIGTFYNSNFINLKIDAEHGEGIELSKRYMVDCFPTFVFVNPSTEKAVHVSASRQDIKTFLYTGKSALDPKKTSTYLEEQSRNGNTDPEFLLEYATYCASRYKLTEVDKIVQLLSANPDYSLNNKKVWDFFEKFLTGNKSPYFKELLKNYAQFSKTYGQDKVDAKLYKEFNFCIDMPYLKSAPNFAGKSFLIAKNSADFFVRQSKFKEAAEIIDSLIANPGNYKEELCQYLTLTARFGFTNEENELWKKKCMTYIKYVAYNNPNRNIAESHYNYASMLEELIFNTPEIASKMPKEITQEPIFGVKEYTMRSPKLAPKNGVQKTPKKKK